MRGLQIAGLVLIAALAGGGPAPAQDNDQMFVTGALSGAIGPDLASPSAVRKVRRDLGSAVTGYAEAMFGKLTATDRERHAEAAITALWMTPGTSPVAWRNFRTKLQGKVTAEVGVYQISGAVCRNFTESLVTPARVEGRFQGVACFDRSNGAWTVWPRPQDEPARAD